MLSQSLLTAMVLGLCVNSSAADEAETVPVYNLQPVTRKGMPENSVVRVSVKSGRRVVQEGTSVAIVCTVDGFLHVDIRWRVHYHRQAPFERKKQVGNSSEYRSVYTIVNVTRWDSGEYICKAYDKERQRHQSGSLVLRVLESPTLQAYSSEVKEGDRAVLRCDGADFVQLIWTFRGTLLGNDAIFHVTLTALIISRVSRDHAGTYECKASTETDLIAYPRLTVFYRPEVVAGPSNATAHVGETVGFQCNVTGYPKPTVTWLLDGDPIVNSSHSSGVQKRYRQVWLAESNVLSVTATKKENTNGPYSCKVENDYGTSVSNSAYVFIQDSPSLELIKITMDGDNKSDWLRISANFRWRRYGLVANYSWAILRVRCTGQESNNFTWSWLARNMTVFPVKDRLVQVECVLISRSSQTLPLVLDLVIKVTATNSLWSDAKEQTMYRSVEVPKWVEQASAIKNLALSVLPIIATNAHAHLTEPAQSSLRTSFHAQAGFLKALPVASDPTEKQHFTTNKYTTGASSPTFVVTWETSIMSPVKYHTLERSDASSVWLSNSDLTPVIPTPSVVYSFNCATPKNNLSPTSSALPLPPAIGLVCGAVLFAIFLCIFVFRFRSKRYARCSVSAERDITDRQFRGILGSLRMHYLGGTCGEICDRKRIGEIPSSLSRASDEFQAQTLQDDRMTASYEFVASPFSSKVESTLHHFTGGSLKVEVGPEGGFYQSDDLSLFFPPGALLGTEQISAAFFFGMNSMPSLGPNSFVFSPILSLGPHNLQFKVPVKIRFPYTAGQGWTLHLKREDSERGWVSVLTVDTDTHEQMSMDTHCNFNVDTAELELNHFCKYAWCGRSKANASPSEKLLGCSLYARMNPSGTSCQFVLHLTDHCNDAYEESKKLLPRSRPHFKKKDCNPITIWPEGLLTIAIESRNFQPDNEQPITIPLRKLWKSFGTQKRVEFSVKRRERLMHDLQVTVNVMSETGPFKESTQLLAFFESPDEQKPTCFPRGLEDEQTAPSSGHGSLSSDFADLSTCEESSTSHATASSASSICSVIDDLIPAVIYHACDGHDWVRFGIKLLGCTEEAVRDEFSSPISYGMKNSDKVRAMIHKWTKTLRSGYEDAIEWLRSAFKEISKEGAFDLAIEDLKSRVDHDQLA